jgi:uncharacterized protein
VVSFCWHGGEPTLAGKEYFKTVLSEQSQYFGSCIKVKNLIQTNGTLIDEEWIELFKKYDLSVGVSIDGSPAAHNRERYYHNRRGSYEDVLQCIKNLIHHDVKFGTLTVMDPSLNGRDVFEHHYQLGIRNMDFCLPVLSHRNFEQQFGASAVLEYSRFMCEVFDAWLDKNDPEVEIRSLENFIRLFIGGTPTACRFSNRCNHYITIEPNGDVAVCEALRVIESNSEGFTPVNSSTHGLSDIYYTQTNVKINSFFEIEEAVQKNFTKYKLNKKGDVCNQCSVKFMCNSGCLLHRYRIGTGFKNPSYFCDYYKTLIEHISHRLNKESVCVDTTYCAIQVA